MTKHRAELALTKLHEVVQEKKSSRQITLTHKVVTRIQETSSIKYFNFSNKWARLLETPWPPQKTSKITTHLGS